MSLHRRSLAKVIVLVPLTAIASVLAIGVGGLVSLTPETRVGIHTLLSLWASIPAAVCLSSMYETRTISSIALSSAFTFTFFLNISAAVSHLFRLVEAKSPRPISYSFADLFELAYMGFLFLLVVWPLRLNNNQGSRFRAILLSSALVAFPLILFGTTWFTYMPLVPLTILQGSSLILGCLAILLLVLSAFMILKYREDNLFLDAGYFATACLLSAISAFLEMSDQFIAVDSWIYAENVAIAAYILYGISIAVPFLRRAGFNRQWAYSVIVGLSIFTYLPVTITVAIEAGLLVIPFGPSNELAFYIIHIGAGSMSAMMALLLFIYSQRSPSRIHTPLILLYGLWTSATIVSAVSTIWQAFSPLGEPIVSYLVASILSLLLLVYPKYWTSGETKTEPQVSNLRGLLTGIGVLGLLVSSGEIVNQLAILQYPALGPSLIGSSVLLILTSVLLLVILLQFFNLADQSEGRISIEISVLLFLTIWIVPNTLKSYYSSWSAGWWVSQLIIFMGLLVGPALMALLYIRALRETEESHDRASLYADLLMHDVSNYHQMLLTSLELLGDRALGNERKKLLRADAKQVVSLADQLIMNVRLIDQTESYRAKTLKPMNLVTIVVDALDEVMQSVDAGTIELNYAPSVDRAPVLANDVLKYVFINILLITFQQPLKNRRITVGVDAHTRAGSKWWRAELSIPGHWVGPEGVAEQLQMNERGFSGTTLGLLVVRLITESIGGSVAFEELDGDSESTKFVVSLPAYEH